MVVAIALCLMGVSDYEALKALVQVAVGKFKTCDSGPRVPDRLLRMVKS